MKNDSHVICKVYHISIKPILFCIYHPSHPGNNSIVLFLSAIVCENNKSITSYCFHDVFSHKGDLRRFYQARIIYSMMSAWITKHLKSHFMSLILLFYFSVGNLGHLPVLITNFLKWLKMFPIYSIKSVIICKHFVKAML